MQMREIAKEFYNKGVYGRVAVYNFLDAVNAFITEDTDRCICFDLPNGLYGYVILDEEEGNFLTIYNKSTQRTYSFNADLCCYIDSYTDASYVS